MFQYEILIILYYFSCIKIYKYQIKIKNYIFFHFLKIVLKEQTLGWTYKQSSSKGYNITSALIFVQDNKADEISANQKITF